MSIDIIPTWAKLALAAAVAAAVVGLVGWQVHHQRDIGRAEVQLKWDADKSATRAAEIVALINNGRVSADLAQDAADNQRKKDETIRAIDARLADALGDYSMLQRATARRESDLPNNTGTCAGGTGTGLARPDAGFLAGYAADAAKLDASYRQCVRLYNRVRSAQPKVAEVK